MITKPNELYIEVIGGGAKGETIIIQLPDGRYGLIDCFTPSLKSPELNVTVARLRELAVTELAFIALTHPHDDHFRGMSHVIKEFTPKQFWIFAGSTKTLFEHLPVYLQAEAIASVGKNDLTSITDLRATLKLMATGVNASQIRLQYLTGIQQLMSWKIRVNDCEVDFTIKSIAPDATIVRKYEEKLVARCQSLPPDTKTDNLDHNDLSAAFLIQFGKSRVLLGGDVTEETWKSLLDHQTNNHIDLTDLAFVKISHHGSHNGYCSGLWPYLAQKNRPLAGLTPYRRQLPEAEAIEQIRDYTQSIVATGLPANSRIVAADFEFPHGTPSLVNDVTRLIAKSAKPVSHIGSFTISLSATGELTGPQLMKGAKEI